LAEQALEKIEASLGKRGSAWTRDAKLPGGDFAHDGYAAEVARLRTDYPFLEDGLAARLVRLYGTYARDILGSAKTITGLGRHFGAELYEAEVRWLVTREWVVTAEDVLWRRTKKGLLLTSEETTALDRFIQDIARFNSAAAE